MDILAILGMGYLLRCWRRRAPERPPASSPYTFPGLSVPPVPPVALAAHLCNALLLRAARGLLLAALLLLLALLPWPTAWATSAALAPIIQPWRLVIVQQLDVLIVSVVGLALSEPLLLRLLRTLRTTPQLCWLLVQLAWITGQIAYWRYRNRRRSIAA